MGHLQQQSIQNTIRGVIWEFSDFPCTYRKKLQESQYEIHTACSPRVMFKCRNVSLRLVTNVFPGCLQLLLPITRLTLDSRCQSLTLVQFGLPNSNAEYFRRPIGNPFAHQSRSSASAVPNAQCANLGLSANSLTWRPNWLQGVVLRLGGWS